MWGHIVLDTFNHNNYNTSFSTQKSNIILYLIKWQYFWWFSFSYLFTFYFLFFKNQILSNTIKFNPQINTSLKSHGKWGDLIISLLPVFWCINILTNSNILLKLVEWQTESSVLTLRIRGKQWYWVYKINLLELENNSFRFISIGNDKHLLVQNFYTNKQCITTYKFKFNQKYLVLTSENKFSYKYFIKKCLPDTLNNVIDIDLKTTQEFIKINKPLVYNYKINVPVKYKFSYLSSLMITKYTYSDYLINIRFFNFLSRNNIFSYVKPFKKELLHKTGAAKYNSINLIRLGNVDRLIGLVYNDLFQIKEYRRYWHTIAQKPIKQWLGSNTLFFAKKQIGIFNETFNLIYKNNFLLKEQEIFNLSNNRRLLRVDSLLVLPINLNLTAITNSFDVVHSWFIPGLGIKMDCVPGRSTHHTFLIETSGFYFGQCAEICGRFHHHMPIKICALPLDQFILWWKHSTGVQIPNKIKILWIVSQ